jgi:hypothetical protein
MELQQDLPGGRRSLRIRVGPLTVAVTEIPGLSLTAHEWGDITLARRSYTAMWGGARSNLLLDEDPLDGRDGELYDTRHYLAWIRDGDEPAKLVTMRRVALDPSRLTGGQRADPLALLPADVQLWKVQQGDGRCLPLWNALRVYARRLAPDDELAEFRIAAIGRTGTFPYAERERAPRMRERTAIAFAAIQLLAAHGDSSLLWVCMLCPEFRDRVLGVVGVDGVYVAPAFTRTEEVLGLLPGSVRLDNDLPVVREHKTAFPGYFVDNDDAARVLAEMLDDGRLSLADLRSAIAEAIGWEVLARRSGRELKALMATATVPDGHRVARTLTRPDLFKFLVPLLVGERPLPGMSAAELRAHLLFETGDGPFSSTLVPAGWAANAEAILRAAEEKYAGPRARRCGMSPAA